MLLIHGKYGLKQCFSEFTEEKMNKHDRRVNARKNKIFKGFFQACQLFGISTTAPQLQLADQPK